MIPLLIAAALSAATPTTSTEHIKPIPEVTIPSDDELRNTGNLCLGILSNKIPLQDVLDKLHLDTREKQQSLISTCLIYGEGFADGIDAANQKNMPANQKKLPEASKNDRS